MRSACSVRLAALVVVAAWLPAVAEARKPPVKPEPRPPLKKLQALGPGIDLVETINMGIHTHGGPPAKIDSLAMNVRVSDGKPHAIAVAKVALLQANCNTPEGTWDSREAMAIVGHELYDWDFIDPQASGKDKVATPARNDLYQVKVALKPTTAYQSCDRFAWGFTATVDGKRFDLELPLRVMREEPLRKE